MSPAQPGSSDLLHQTATVSDSRRPNNLDGFAYLARGVTAEGVFQVQNLLVLLACIFAGIALMVVVTERYGKTGDAETTARLRRWILPLVGLLLVLSALNYFLGGLPSGDETLGRIRCKIDFRRRIHRNLRGEPSA